MALVAGPILALAFLSAPAVSASTPDSISMSDGKALFLENKCTSCHSVTAKGVEGAKPDKAIDISKVTDSEDFLTKYLKKEVTKDVDGKASKHKKSWKGSDEDLAAIIGWLKS
jgi:mono/diheme cytochrome c family protein